MGPIGQTPGDSIRLAIERVFARDEFQWREPSGPLAWLRRQWAALVRWLEQLQSDQPTLFLVLVVALAVTAVAILVHLGVLAFRVVTAREGPPAERHADVAMPPNPDAMTQQAETLAGDGRYREAVIMLFQATLVRLDAQRAIRFHPSKTPAEYVIEASLRPTGRSALAGMVDRLYHYLFGDAPCHEDEWRAFRSLAEEVPGDVAPA